MQKALIVAALLIGLIGLVLQDRKNVLLQNELFAVEQKMLNVDMQCDICPLPAYEFDKETFFEYCRDHSSKAPQEEVIYGGYTDTGWIRACEHAACNLQTYVLAEDASLCEEHYFAQAGTNK